MKKALLLVMAIMTALGLFGCGPSKEQVDKEQVEKDLQGTWNYSWYATVAQKYCSTYYEFDDGSVTHTFYRDGAMDTYETGEYIIEDDCISVFLDDGTDVEFKYTYEDGELCLVDYGDGSVENEYEKLD